MPPDRKKKPAARDLSDDQEGPGSWERMGEGRGSIYAPGQGKRSGKEVGWRMQKYYVRTRETDSRAQGESAKGFQVVLVNRVHGRFNEKRRRKSDQWRGGGTDKEEQRAEKV